MSKSRAAVVNMSSNLISSSSSAASTPIASKSPVTSGASGRLGSTMKIAPSSFDAVSTSQVKLKDAHLGGFKEKQQGDVPHESEGNSGETDDSESEPCYYKPAPQKKEACGKPLAGGSAELVSSEFQKSQSNEGATMEHFLAISAHHVPYINEIYDTARKVYAKTSGRSYERFEREYGFLVNIKIYVYIYI